jgi:hypothetical protein
MLQRCPLSQIQPASAGTPFRQGTVLWTALKETGRTNTQQLTFKTTFNQADTPEPHTGFLAR